MLKLFHRHILSNQRVMLLMKMMISVKNLGWLEQSRWNNEWKSEGDEHLIRKVIPKEQFSCLECREERSSHSTSPGIFISSVSMKITHKGYIVRIVRILLRDPWITNELLKRKANRHISLEIGWGHQHRKWKWENLYGYFRKPLPFDDDLFLKRRRSLGPLLASFILISRSWIGNHEVTQRVDQDCDHSLPFSQEKIEGSWGSCWGERDSRKENDHHVWWCDEYIPKALWSWDWSSFPIILSKRSDYSLGKYMPPMKKMRNEMERQSISVRKSKGMHQTPKWWWSWWWPCMKT